MEKETKIIIKCPGADELATDPKQDIVCPVEGCGMVLQHGAALRLHKVKIHRIIEGPNDEALSKGKKDKSVYIYHCPVKTCKYYKDKERHFNYYGRLRQHYLIQHGEKKFTCEKCKSVFGVEKSLTYHKKSCGVIFKCGTCDCPFSSVHSLRRHCTSQKHSLPPEFSNKSAPIVTPEKKKKENAPNNQPNEQPQVNIFVINMPPSNADIVHEDKYIPIKPKTLDVTQCDYERPSTSNQESNDHRSIETQMDDVPTAGASTQTTGDYILMNAMLCANIPVQNDDSNVHNAKGQVRKESRSSQVSPRAKIRAEKRVSTATQSFNFEVPKNRRKRKMTNDASTSHEIPQQKIQTAIQTYSIPEFSVDDYSDMDTQTISLFEELEATLAASISTQTRESYLNKPTIQCTQTIETQTNTSLNDGYISADDSLCRINTPSILTNNEMISSGTDPSLSEQINDDRSIDGDFSESCFVDAGTSTLVSSNTQTQTIDSMCEQILSHMETQTGDDFDISDLLFTDNETQTAYDIDHVSSSVETQTALQATHQSQANVKTDMQTQTLFPGFDIMYETSCQTEFDSLFENIENI